VCEAKGSGLTRRENGFVVVARQKRMVTKLNDSGRSAVIEIRRSRKKTFARGSKAYQPINLAGFSGKSNADLTGRVVVQQGENVRGRAR